MARRYQRLSEEISELDEQLDRLVTEAAPELVAVEGVGTDTAASLLIAAGDNPERLENEAAFAHLCGAAPIPASSGKSVRLMPHEPRRAYPILRGKAHCRGQNQEVDHPLPQEIHCPRDLPGPLLPILTQTLDFGALTNIEASPVIHGPCCRATPKPRKWSRRLKLTSSLTGATRIAGESPFNSVTQEPLTDLCVKS